MFEKFVKLLKVSMAERKGFEPSIRYSRIHAFQACDLNHSSTSLWTIILNCYSE